MALLHLTYADLMSAIGNYLGYGFDSTTYSTTATNACDRILQSGLRRFYYFRGVVDNMMFDGWSFMNPTATISLVAGTSTYTLASDFSDMDGTFTWAAGNQRPAIVVVDEQNIREMYASNNFSGFPIFAAIKSIASTGSAAQGKEVVFYPQPDAAGTLTYRYYADPLVLTSGASYPLGGAAHAETIKASCLAMAEMEGDDTQGVYAKDYDRLLQQSVRIDRGVSAPEYLGKNIDRSDYPYQIYRG